MNHDDEADAAFIAKVMRSVLLGRCWLAALLLATGHAREAEEHLAAIADRLPLKDTWWS